jgi:hypothetical protein
MGGTCQPEARGNCHKGWQRARKVPSDFAGQLEELHDGVGAAP